MSGFFSSDYQVEMKYKRTKHALVVFSVLGCACILLAWSSLPSPFGEKLGNDLSIALVGAFASAAVILGLELYETYEMIIDRAWRCAISTHDCATDDGSVSFLPFFCSVEEAAMLTDEMLSKPLFGLPQRRDCYEEYRAKRSKNDERFSKMPPSEQHEAVLVEVKSWQEKAEPQIQRYYEMKCAAKSMANMRPLLKMLPSTAVVRGFLDIVDIADELIAVTNFDYHNREKSLHEGGWGSPGCNLLGLNACNEKMKHYIIVDISNARHSGQKHQVKLYKLFLHLAKKPFSFAPKDKAFFEPWGSTITRIEPQEWHAE